MKVTDRYNLAPIARLAPTTRPMIDGVVDRREWYGATLFPRLIAAADGAVAQLRTRVFAAYDDKNLYVAFQIDRPTNSLKPGTPDSVSLLLDPSHEHKAPLNFSGTVEGPIAGKDWEYKARMTDTGWEGEMAIPFASLKRSMPKPGEVWGFDFVNRQETPVPDVSALSFTTNRETSRDFSHVVFAPAGSPIVRFREAGTFMSETGGGASIEIVNVAGGSTIESDVSIDLQRRKSGAAGGSDTYLAGVARATATHGADLILPAEDLAQMIEEHAENYAPATQPSAKVDEKISLAADQRTEVRATQTDPGDYLCRYRVAGKDGNVLSAGVLPFNLSAPLRVVVQPFFLSPKVIQVRTDLRRVPEWSAGAKLNFAIRKRGEEKALAEVERTFEASPLVNVELPTATLAPGGYEVTTELIGADGQRKALLTDGFTKPADPQWITKPIFTAPIVPPPWTPIRATDKKLSFLMGEYDFGAAPLATQIRVRSIYEEKRVPILRAPMSLKGSINGKDISWASGASAEKTKRVDLVERTASQTFGGLTVASDVQFEYDGMAKVVLDLSGDAKNKPSIDALWLDVPLTPEFSKLFQYAPGVNGMRGPRPAGELKIGETLPFEWTASMWMGNEERGFRWFAENWRGWHLDKDAAASAIEIVTTEEGATLRVHFVKVAKPFVLDKPRQIVFGFEFTPPKTIDSRIPFASVYNDRLQEEAQCGVNVAEVWYYKYQGWPEIYSDAELKQKIATAKYMHANGVSVTPYSGWYIARDSDIYKAWGGEMTTDPVAGAGCGCDQNCWNTAVADAYTSLLADRARDSDIDGFRMDAGFTVENCRSLVHRGYGSQCGWIDDDGQLQPSRAIFAARKAAQRAYQIFHGGVKSDGWCLHHIHQGNRYDAILSHEDAVVSAEGPELNMTKLSDFPLGFYRAFVMGDAHGYRVVYMPKSQRFGVDSRLGIGLIHNLVPRGYAIISEREVSNSRNALSAAGIWRAYQWIKVNDIPKTELWGYWKNSAYLDTGDKNCVGTFWVRRGEKLLLALLNLERQPVERTIKIDFAKLGFTGGSIFARDANTFDEIPVAGNSITLPFTSEGYRLIEFAPAPLDPWTPHKISGNLIPEISPTSWDDKAIAAQWYARTPAGGVSLRDGQIVVNNDGTGELGWRKIIPDSKKGRSYLLEAEVRFDCEGDVYPDLDPYIKFAEFSIGEVYNRHVQSMGTQSLPGRFEKIRLWYTGRDEKVTVFLGMRGKGTMTFRNLELYEIDNPIARPGFTQ